MAKTIVIGGGPAGMMAAATAAQNGNSVTLIEHNEKLGKKLYITGKGRCNLTNTTPTEDFFQNVPRNPKFLYSAIYSYTSDDIIALIESLGVPVKRERGGRVFPVSDKSSDVLFALSKYVRSCGVEVLLNRSVYGIDIEKGKIKSVRTDRGAMECDALVVATGGVSYKSTGSTGDGYTFAKEAGHNVIQPRPALIPMTTSQEWPKHLMGLSLRNVRLSAFCNKRLVFDEIGEMLFTHFGVSGPLVLSASSMADTSKPVRLVVDLKPGLTTEQLDDRILRDFDKYIKKSARNGMVELLPSKLIVPFLELCNIDPDKPVHQITKEERSAIRDTLKGMVIDVNGTRPIDEAIITRGGVDTREINPSTMESKLVKGLYFAGEVIDVDALTGGFNMQIAFSTGHLAGKSIGEQE